MDHETYRQKYFVDPLPLPPYNFSGVFGVTLYFEDYEAAVAYYSEVLGPPAYLEGTGTRGWSIGGGWLTLLKGKAGNPCNIEVTFVVAAPSEADELQKAFIQAGGKGPPPSNEWMYQPVRFCSVVDPFGTSLLIISSLE